VNGGDVKQEMDFKDLIRKPEKLFGYGYIYLLGALLLLGILYARNLSVIGKNAVVPTVLKDSTAFVLDIPMKSPSILPPVDVAKVGRPTDALVGKGKELFRASCTPCHGESGFGDGPTAATLNPKPRNFHSLAGWSNGSRVSQIYKTLQEGIVKNGMASYNYLPPEDRFALAHYIRTFSPGQPVDTQDELQQLETVYQLSKGASSPGQIPVKKAAGLLVAESAPQVAAVAACVKQVESDANDPGARLLKSVSADLGKVLTALRIHRNPMPSLDDFVRTVSGDPHLIGFKPSVVQLTETEWSTLHDYLSRLSLSLPGTASGVPSHG
jgi:mono/diheme cytochrome c family protein